MIFLLLPLLLSSCYQPMYGTKSMAMDATQPQTRLNRIAISSIPDEQGHMLRNFLIDRMYGSGRPITTEATLTVSIKSVEEDLGLQRDATTLRRKITYTATYTLRDNAKHQTLYSGTSRTLVSYNKLDAQYGALSSLEDSKRRAMRELSDLIITQLLVYYDKHDHEASK